MHSTSRQSFGLALLLATTVGAAPADDDPDDRLALGRRAFVENCLMCHAEELTSRSRLTPAQWGAEVDKMIGWGAPVPPDQKDDLREYLIVTYPETAPTPDPARITLEEALATIRPEADPGGGPAGDPERGASLFTANCATCHGSEARGGDLGTNLVEVPVLLRPGQYTEVVRKGLRRMPGFEQALDPRQEADILAWLRERRYTNPAP